MRVVNATSSRKIIVDLLPPRIPDQKLFALLARILAPPFEADGNATLRLQLIDKGLSWQALTDLANAQGVFIPLIWALMKRSLLLPLPIGTVAAVVSHHPTAQLTKIYNEHLARRRRQRDQLSGIVRALNRENIEPLLLKGARYLFALPGSWAEARDMRDIDVLVHPHEAGRSISALSARGYTVDPRPVPVDQHLPEMWHSAYPSAVEVHIEALAFSARAILSTDEIWRRATRSSNEQGTFFLLPAEWHLLHALLGHQISDRGHVRRILAVRPLWEFVMLASEVSDDGWKSIGNHMTARDHADALGSWIVQAGRIYEFACPKPIKISPAAHAHASSTIRTAGAPGWLRRGRFLADQFLFAFSRHTLAARYRLPPEDVSLGTMGHHLQFLARHYRGHIRDRLFGRDNRLS